MDNRTLIAILLSLAVIIGFQFFFGAQEQTQVIEEQDFVEEKEEPAQPFTSPIAIEPSTTEYKEELAGKEIKVENELYYAVLTSKGGSIKHWEIKSHKDKNGGNVVLLEKPGILPAIGIGANNNFDLANVYFNISGRDLRLNSNNPSGTIIFEYSGDNFFIKRTYTFYSDTYTVDLKDEVSGLPEYWVTIGSDFGIFENDSSYTHVGPALLTGTDLEELKPKKLIKETKIFTENLKWIAQEDKYFFSALVPRTAVEEVRAWTYKDSPAIAFKGKTGINRFTIYAGPKEHDRLLKLDIGLEHIINFGFFSPISRPLFWVLKFFYRFLGNYGWAIILLTIVTRIPFIPLINKGQRSMKKLQTIQPKMAAIKEQYKKDPKKMQKEMSELYKKHKVNPIGGCLPMLLQIPVFFALYKVLMIAIELRGAPFLLWITDLSLKDPYYVLPIIMGITMVIQQKMTPSSMDPKQAKIMMLMPVVLTFVFLNFAAGLVLYWLVNNILGIIQQFYINRKPAKEPA